MTTISATSRTSCAATASPDGLGPRRLIVTHPLSAAPSHPGWSCRGCAGPDVPGGLAGHEAERDRQLGQASWTQVPQARLRASCRGITGWPHRPQRCPAARAALASHPAGSVATKLSPIGPEPVTGNPAPPGQKCSRCTWRTRSPIDTRSPPCPRAFRPARSSLSSPGHPGRPPGRSRSATVIRSSLRVRACPSHRKARKGKGAPADDDDDLGDVAEILRRRGIAEAKFTFTVAFRHHFGIRIRIPGTRNFSTTGIRDGQYSQQVVLHDKLVRLKSRSRYD